jgi:hypothetical protein
MTGATDRLRRPDVDEELQARYVPAKRTCLCFQRKFASTWSGNRICGDCRGGKAFTSASMVSR